jgi:hypothetical protein
MTNKWGPGCNCCTSGGDCLQCVGLSSFTISGVPSSCSGCASNFNGTYNFVNGAGGACKQGGKFIQQFTCESGDVFITANAPQAQYLQIAGIVLVVPGGFEFRLVMSAIYRRVSTQDANYREVYYNKARTSCNALKGVVPFETSIDLVLNGTTLGDYCGLEFATVTIA